MGAHCCNHESPETALRSKRYRRILWIALAVNLLMFAVEIGAGLKAGSVSLLADSLDFLGDSANYAISLWVLGMALSWRARAAQFKAASMLLFGLGVLGAALWHWWQGAVPSAPTMGVVGSLALLANVGVAVLLYAYREGDSNMRSVWLCTRNDALGNLAVLAAALGVFGTGSAWPDLIVATIMATLAITAAVQVLRQADGELKDGHGHAH
ncbi:MULTISPECIES: cation diffusion facilitator family transporter [unclassified Pseudomonas]|uniref:cation diffusion facilitator family transporter n=1 Tax=unclassified Pseudomonas TaxID=196821 RepID=UPI00244D5AA5|nr:MULTISPECIES: cation diffusion facilitator family transporter [unclassified Pseudomonas]MDG9922248.1 cation diffusion facilitator family transporter [Pseudomonas sp. GD04045]MDH0033659.1 cation diffusion facilitator family transporter [Pseudomonas sp. GD04019]